MIPTSRDLVRKYSEKFFEVKELQKRIETLEDTIRSLSQANTTNYNSAVMLHDSLMVLSEVASEHLNLTPAQIFKIAMVTAQQQRERVEYVQSLEKLLKVDYKGDHENDL